MAAKAAEEAEETQSVDTAETADDTAGGRAGEKRKMEEGEVDGRSAKRDRKPPPSKDLPSDAPRRASGRQSIPTEKSRQSRK
eukprot:21306-Prorocentrum_minimum.AAC.1